MKFLFKILLPFCFSINSIAMETPLLQDSQPLIGEQLLKLRNPLTDREQFRNSLKKTGIYIGTEIAKTLPTKEISVKTLFNVIATHKMIEENIVLIPIMRAGLPLHEGLQEAFPKAESAFFGVSKDKETSSTLMEYVAFPKIENKCVIICDPMIASGGSIVEGLKLLKQKKPKKIIITAVIATKKGIARILDFDPNIEFFVCCIDDEINKDGWILPGLGDAGDRSYGVKLASKRKNLPSKD